ncbi:hypothetical protein BP5796_13157 [Coleophoma crateriformis]|uniref:Uncharacterized protein n=1 Tax=Coleophoma crateriformis TaxID=565419 RepID=A0A3D8Q3S6_9HELO|nr:hypothetical protein BP5796_13157 [Coleophoma crateriformis]
MGVGRSGSAPDMLTPVQHVLENGREIFEHNIILVTEFVYKDKSKHALFKTATRFQNPKLNEIAILKSSSNSVSVASAASSRAVASAVNASISMSSAVSAASVASSMASSAMVASSMASSMALSIASSASAAIAVASASASSMMSLIQSSASEAVLSASAEVSSARETATIALEQAQQTIIAEGQVSALKASSVTATTAAIAIVTAIIGSSLLSILGYFLLTRYKRNKASQATAIAEEHHQPPSFQNGHQTSAQSNRNDRPLVTGRVSFRSSQDIVSNSKSTMLPVSRLPSSRWLFGNFVSSRQDFESEKKLNPPPDFDLPPTPTLRDVMTGNLKRVNPFRGMRTLKSDIVRVKEPNLFVDELEEMKPKKSDKVAGLEYLFKE